MPHATARFAVFGHPIAHSKSPAIHAAFARQFGIDLTFETIDAAPADFADAVRDFFASGAGANVTLPHKRAALELADSATEAATRAGTANVLTPVSEGHLQAHNTDGAGMVRDLTERHHEDLRSGDVLLLGAGGAAHGVAGPLLDTGIARLTIVNRTCERAEMLVDHLGDPERARAHRWEDLDTFDRFDTVINTTSAGVNGGGLQLPPNLVDSRTLCYDLSYGAGATHFLAWARGAGARLALDGLGMLVETAADAFELWHGKRPGTESVYRHLRDDEDAAEHASRR